MVIEILILVAVIYAVTWYSLRVVGHFFFNLFNNEEETVVWWLSFLFLPGTFIHEVGHLVVAEFLLVRTDNFTILPQIQHDKGVKLGSVQIGECDPIRRLIIGIAPLLVAFSLITYGTYFVFTSGISWWLLILYIYFLIQLTHSMFSSKKDMEGFLIGTILVVAVVLLGRFIGGYISFPVLRVFSARLVGFLVENEVHLRNGLRYALAADVVFAGIFLMLLKLNRKKIS